MTASTEAGRLVASLTAALDEEEAAAKAAASNDDRARSWTTAEGGYPVAGPVVVDGWSVAIVPLGPRWGQVRHIARQDPARTLRRVAAHRDLIAAILSQPHRQVEDGWYSCAQAADEDDPEPGSACLDEDRAGGPCNCGRDARVERLLKIMAGIYEETS